LKARSEIMPAPTGNTFAARPGIEKKFRVRVPDESDLLDIGKLDTYARGVALRGYLLWLESPESDESSFITWIRQIRITGNK
jgi:hypothetical protein